MIFTSFYLLIEMRFEYCHETKPRRKINPLYIHSTRSKPGFPATSKVRKTRLRAQTK